MGDIFSFMSSLDISRKGQSNMHGENISYAYGFWFLVLVNVALFCFFILSFLTSFKKREWRAMGVTLGFFVALFTEMYRYPADHLYPDRSSWEQISCIKSLLPCKRTSMAYISWRRGPHDDCHPYHQ